MLDLLERIDAVCEEFEDALARGERPGLETLVAEWSGEERLELLANLIPIELHYLRRSGEDATLPDYRARFPGVRLEALPGEARRIGDYQVEQELGRGGMGVVYVARQLSLDRRVALKVLPEAAAFSSVAVERFRREARAAARLSHPGIVPVYEVGEQEGTAYISMKLIEGESLDALRRRLEQRLDGGGLEAPTRASRHLAHHLATDRARYHRDVARLGLQVAEALAHAHAHGVLHRDVKPSNLLLDGEGRVWIADFGLARTEDSELTTSGDFLGTLRYMSPERLHGRCDERADVYGLGATLYELLTLRRIQAESRRTALIDAIERREPAAPRLLDPALSRDLETVVQRAIAKDPERRYPGADELADDLRRFLEGRPVLARPVSGLERLVRWTRTHRSTAILLGTSALLLVLLLVASIAAALIFSLKSRENADLAALEADAREEAEVLARERQRTLYFAQMQLASDAVNTPGGVRALRDHVDSWARPTDDQIDPRGWEWSFLNAMAHQELRVIETAAAARDLAWHPSRPWIATSTSPVLLLDAESGEEIARLDAGSGHGLTLCFSPDGRWLAVGGTTAVVVWDVDARTVWRRLPMPAWVGGLAFDPDSRRLAVQCMERAVLELWDLESEELLTSTRGRLELPVDAPFLGFSADGQWIATSGREGAVWVLDAGNLAPVHRLGGHLPPINALAFSERGMLASGGTDPLLRVWDPSSGRLVASLAGHTARVSGVHWSGDRLASSSWDYTVRVWDVEASRQLLVLGGHTRNVRAVRWSPDGRFLASAGDDAMVRIWSSDLLRAPQRTLRLAPVLAERGHLAWPAPGVLVVTNHDDGWIVEPWEGKDPVYRPGTGTVSPDGQLLAWNFQGRLAIEAARTGEVLRERELDHATDLARSAFSPDGRRLAQTLRDGLAIVEVDGGLESVHVPCRLLRCLSWSPDGSRLAYVDGDTVILRDPSGMELVRRQMVTAPDHLSWSPDGSRLVLGARDQMGHVLAAHDLTTESTLVGHTHQVWGTAWSPSGDRIATAGWDHTARVWDVASGTLVATFRLGERGVGVAWDPSGRVLASLDAAGELILRAAPE